MFGFSLATQLFQGSAQRTWNCVTHFTNLLWYKFNHIRYPIMPRSRRRHHSRSRSRSRSHSHDKDRDAKRRKLDNVDSPLHKRSVSCEPPSPATDENNEIEVPGRLENLETDQSSKISDKNQTETVEDTGENLDNVQAARNVKEKDESTNKIPKESLNESKTNDEPKENPIKHHLEAKLIITPKKALSPKQAQKKLESEKKRQQKQAEREEREKLKQQEKDRIRLEKEKQKQEKDEQKAKERELKEEQKRKEKEEKEAKRKEREEREEAKRKEREMEKLKKQQELEEKNREKQKMEEQKQKTSQAFVSFFKKTEAKIEENKSEVKLFMPFEIKSDMRLAPSKRANLSEEGKRVLDEFLNGKHEERLYLSELKGGKKTGKGSSTWPYEEDVMIIIEEDFGESICEDKQQPKKMRAKFLKFHENKRPAYYGTWRKKSSMIKSRRPCIEDKNFFDYEVDSDDDWEEEEQGESLNGSDDEDKENEADNEDYEVDNDFFVPHGHLSDDEVDDEATSKLSPESHKQKLKLLKDEFDQDMQAKTNKMKPRSIGCIWYNKDGSNVDEAIDRYLKPLAMLIAGQVFLKKRKNLIAGTPNRKCNTNELSEELIPAFLKLVHGNTNKKKIVVQEFITYMQKNGHVVEVTKRHIGQRLNQLAQWKKCEEGPKRNNFCWLVEDDVKKKYNLVVE